MSRSRSKTIAQIKLGVVSPAAVVSKRFAGDVGLPRGEGSYYDPQLCEQQIEVASSIISAPSLHQDSDFD
jgi:hypothetical protein